MAVTVSDLARYVGVDPDGLPEVDGGAESARVDSAFSSAVLGVDQALSRVFRPVPEEVRDRLVLEVGHAYYKRSDSPTGSSQGVDFSTGQAVLGPRDPLAQVWPIIRRYTLPF